ncbi:MAG: T9SS type A sorting domain-containing protein [Chitinophagaceae bacterium]|nr:T9SS type A sorting domain-containing protein [Chitinophagaceae bacterium]
MRFVLVVILLSLSSDLFAQITRLQSVVTNQDFDTSANLFVSKDSLEYVYPTKEIAGNEEQQFGYSWLDKTHCKQFNLYQEFLLAGMVLMNQREIIRDSTNHTVVFKESPRHPVLQQLLVNKDSTFIHNALNQLISKSYTTYDIQGKRISSVVTKLKYDASGKIKADSTWLVTDTSQTLTKCSAWTYTDSTTESIKRDFNNGEENYRRFTTFDIYNRVLRHEERYQISDTTFGYVLHHEYYYDDSFSIHHFSYSANASNNFEEYIYFTYDTLGMLISKYTEKKSGQTFLPYHKTVWNYEGGKRIKQEEIEYTAASNYQPNLNQLFLYEYTASGKLLQIQHDIYDMNGVLSHSTLETYSYNEDDNIIELAEWYKKKGAQHYTPVTKNTFNWERISSDTTVVPPNQEIKMYPNPFQDKLNFSFDYPYEGKAHIQVFSMQGQLLDHVIEHVHAGLNEFSYRRHLPLGLYYITLSTREFNYANLFLVQ